LISAAASAIASPPEGQMRVLKLGFALGMAAAIAVLN
jgi:hypothetical protein